MKTRCTLAVLAALLAAGCSAGTTAVVPPASAVSPARLTASKAIPKPYRCFPSGLPAAAATFSPALAYISQCAVDRAPEAANLQKLAIALMQDHGAGFAEYCTGTPLSYDAATGVGFVVTAAHCVVGGTKPVGAALTPANIITFSDHAQWVYQSTPGLLKNDPTALTGEINAVYVPARYCQAAAIGKIHDSFGCKDLTKQNGDVALLKIVGVHGHTMSVLPNLRLAPATLAMSPNSYLMALGYGTNTTSTPDDRVLYYVDYQYFANDLYRRVPSESSIMNGYFANKRFYSIICQGDSGGGDFYWDGTHWNLVGAHSWGPTPCGVSNAKYLRAFDVSADLRPWRAFIARIVAQDSAPTGCARLSRAYVCLAR
jgi:hypothetical protein